MCQQPTYAIYTKLCLTMLFGDEIKDRLLISFQPLSMNYEGNSNWEEVYNHSSLVTYVIIVILFLWLQDDPSFAYITVNGLSIDACAGITYLTANGVFESHHDVWPLFKVWKGWQVIQNMQLNFIKKKYFLKDCI